MSKKTEILISIGVVIFLLVVFGGYGFYKAKAYLEGPAIFIESPKNEHLTLEPFTRIAGKASNVSNLFINGRQIFTGKNGSFVESLLLAPGYNIIEIKGNDKFGRETKEKLEIIYKDK